MAINSFSARTMIVISAVALSSLFGSVAASAAEAPPATDAGAFTLRVPPGTSVESLMNQNAPGVVTSTGCPAGAGFSVQADYNYQVSGVTVVLPILLTPGIIVLADGVATVPLEPVSLWLSTNALRHVGTVVLVGSCFPEPSGTEAGVAPAQATLTIPYRSDALGLPPPLPDPTGPAAAVPSAQTVPVPDDEPATAVVAQPTLADTGFAATGTLVLGVLLAGAGILLVATRRRSDLGLLSPHHAQQTEDPGCG
ncbi:hypothetical protein [Cryobacterium cryoconiti]|uniref:LPXTG cell wall anchor domain-containing protein n=1 Tax=Cryobacterium cryoconiti TaxID=1259239 RepID=A0A4Y8JX89_9MICO|nr:hypothetical protein [Cryobacterium cryoconiti]TFD32250.1 hypothetical protein E3T49_04615 [Cryobacterium cryoconiti]